MNMRSTKETVNLSAWALKNQQMVSFFMLLVMAMGVFCYERLPRNEDPAFTIKTAGGIGSGHDSSADGYA